MSTSNTRDSSKATPRLQAVPAALTRVNGLGVESLLRMVRRVTDGGVTLSVVIPARNEASILGYCLTALSGQSDPVDEIILVDNDSSDSTAAVARSHPGVVVVREPRPGVTYARNTGFDAATADVIVRIDADTIVTADWARSIRRAFAADRSLAGLTGPAGFTRLSSSGRVIGRAAYALIRAIHEQMIGSGPVMYGHNMALTRAAWIQLRDAVTCGDDAISEDLDVTLALVRSGQRIGYEPGMLVSIGVERTLRDGKLARYRRTNRLTMAKYRNAHVEVGSASNEQAGRRSQ